MLSRLKFFIARGVAWLFAAVVDILEFPLGRRQGGLIRGAVIDALMNSTVHVRHGATNLRFSCPNWIATLRANTFATKEPETLAWIDGFAQNSVLWDIGANVGLYTVYAAKRHRDCQVIAFEPSVLNVELLARNVNINLVVDNVCIVPFALSEDLGIAAFALSNLDRGGAMSAFGVSYGFDGQPLVDKMKYRMIGLSSDQAIERLGLPPPNYLKIDVDGIEHLILRGAALVLANPALKSVLVETSDIFAEQRHEIAAILTGAGFVETRPSHAADTDTYNGIWIRRSGR